MPDTDLSLTALRALSLIRETGSMSRAAQTLSVSQPAISRAVSALENHFGLSLVSREERPLILTAEGHIVADFAQRIDGNFADLANELERRKRGQQGTVTIGSFGASASTWLLPDLLKSFARYNPQIHVAIREYDDQDVLSALQDGDVDAAVLANPPEQLDQVQLGNDQLVGLVPSHHRLAERSELTPQDFFSDPFILTKAGSEPLIRAWFTQSDSTLPKAYHRIRQTASIMALVSVGLGISIVARYALPEDIGDLKAVPLNPRAPRTLALVRRPESVKSHAFRLFWAFAERNAAAE